MLKNLINELEDLKRINLLNKSDHIFILEKLKSIRECITTSGFLDIEEDYTFNVKEKLRRDIAYREDLISRLVTVYNQTRACIVSNVINIVKDCKKSKEESNREYYIESFISKIPGNIKHKRSTIFFRYLNDKNLEEIENDVIPEIKNSWDNKGLRNRLLFLHLHKILSAYLFINFSRFTIHSSSINFFYLNKIANREDICLKKMSNILSSCYNTDRSSIENIIENYIIEISNIINSESDKNIQCLVHQYGDNKYLIKVVSVFVSKKFRDFVSSERGSFYNSGITERYINNGIDKAIEKLFNNMIKK